jgi:DNA repair photolyase
MKITYTELVADSALHKLKRRIPYAWDLNIYRGCEHGCKYCYAIYSHDYLNDGNFFDRVYYKKNIIEQLEKELSSPDWKREIVNIGGVTDSYQPIEKELKIMPEILKLMIKYKTPIIISTKSDLILRDIDLINELSKITYVNIAFTITTMDENIREKLEPNASSSIRRFKALSEFKKTNASLGVHMMPIIPYLTDSYENLDAIYRMAADIKVDYVLPGTLYLRGKTKPYFLDFIEKENKEIYNKLFSLYKTGGAGMDYKNKLYKKVNEIKSKYGVSSNYMVVLKNKLKNSK